MAIKQQVMALNPARKGNMGRLNSSQPLYVYDTLIVQPWLKGVVAQIRGLSCLWLELPCFLVPQWVSFLRE